TKPPEISIVLPFRNAAATLPDCLASIARQSFKHFELLAIDDDSTDGSAEIVQAAAQRDARIRLIQPGRVGLVAALNIGLAEARAPLIARMDADDLMHEERLAAQHAFLAQRLEIALVATQVELFPSDQIQAGYQEYIRWQNTCITPEQIANNIYVESPFAHPSVMFRSEVVQALGGYADGPFPEDYELWLRMHQSGARMAKLPRVLLHWRERADRTSRNDPRYAREAFDQLRARFLARDARVRGDRPLAIWGAGRKTRLRARHLLNEGLGPIAWIDIDPHKIGHEVWGVMVQPPEWLDQRPKPFVLVYVASHGARELIAGRLARLGYQPGLDYLAVG
ncbi:MAG TPA: glycosyltransferase, partial [Roseiflexaceae bacterium]|nr:glycosyltransferase [Roseiflexaceae bacterium]